MPIGTASLIGLGLGAAGGLGKYALGSAKAGRDRKLAAATQRYSPWTNLQANEIHEPNLAGDLLGGSSTGLALGSSLSKSMAPAAGAGASLDSVTPGGGGYGMGMFRSKMEDDPFGPNYGESIYASLQRNKNGGI